MKGRRRFLPSPRSQWTPSHLAKLRAPSAGWGFLGKRVDGPVLKGLTTEPAFLLAGGDGVPWPARLQGLARIRCKSLSLTDILRLSPQEWKLPQPSCCHTKKSHGPHHVQTCPSGLSLTCVQPSGCGFRMWSDSASSPQGIQGPLGPKGDAGAFGLKGGKVSDSSPRQARLGLYDPPSVEQKFLLEAGSRP